MAFCFSVYLSFTLSAIHSPWPPQQSLFHLTLNSSNPLWAGKLLLSIYSVFYLKIQGSRKHLKFFTQQSFVFAYMAEFTLGPSVHKWNSTLICAIAPQATTFKSAALFGPLYLFSYVHKGKEDI